MKLDYEKKEVSCDCGRIHSMIDVEPICCSHCDCTFLDFECGCGQVLVPHIVYSYVDTYQDNSMHTAG